MEPEPIQGQPQPPAPCPDGAHYSWGYPRYYAIAQMSGSLGTPDARVLVKPGILVRS